MRFKSLLLFVFGFLLAFHLNAQLNSFATNPNGIQNRVQKDSTSKTNTGHWKDERAKIVANRAFSAITIAPDTTIHNFQRRPFLLDWYRDLGNHGTPAISQLFIPNNIGNTGPSLGYHVFDIYQLKRDSLLYYNTTRPYTIFDYQLSAKLEQTLRLMHTQNIRPNWNIAVQYQKIASQGFYKIQRTNHDGGGISSHYNSNNQHYELYGALVYNKEQSDENGGITADSFLLSKTYSDRQTIPVALDNPYYRASSSAGRRSAVTNVMRDFDVLIRHQYKIGKRDTIYNTDSTQFAFRLIPKFSLRHQLEMGSEKHKFKDLAPDSALFSSFFNRSFATNDSVFTEQRWGWLDNYISLNGFLGAHEKKLAINAGIGNRVDNFYTAYVSGKATESILSTYLNAEIKKEALSINAWAYEANAKFIIAGPSLGNFLLKGSASKDFGEIFGTIKVGGMQQLSDAPYAYTIYQNQYFLQQKSLNKEAITMFWAELNNPHYGFVARFKNYIIGNYIYLKDSLETLSNGKLQFSQATTPFNLSQLSLQKTFRLRHFVLDNEFAMQQIAGAAPISVPSLLGKHTLSYENFLFSNALKIATGAEFRYHTQYQSAGYSPFYNQFYYQSIYTTNNKPEASVFFNFKIKRFRAYLMADQLQTLVWRNTIITPNYASQNLMVRFGFNWILVN